MNYVKAKNVLPSELLEKIQEYVAGTYLYIPQKCENRKNWENQKIPKTGTKDGISGYTKITKKDFQSARFLKNSF